MTIPISACFLGLALAACLVIGSTPAHAAGFSQKTASTLTADQVAGMECRYFIELLGVHTPEQLERQLAPIAGTEVTTVVCCPMGWRFYNFPSEVDLTWKEPAKYPRNRALFPNWMKMVDNLAAGGDPLKDALAATRRMGKRFVLSFRMNDTHYIHIEDFPTHNNFWRAHPEYRLGHGTAPSDARTDSSGAFNYLHPEVRDFYFSVLEELCTKYDVDGVELDFQRAPRFFYDREVEAGRPVMTAHIARIRAMLDRIGKQRGRHLELSVRSMHTVQANLNIGADVMAWDAAGWLDGIVVSSSYIHTADVGIEEFVAERRKARIYGELNYVHFQAQGTGHDPAERRYLTAETYRAATLSYLERGADGVSYFNTYCIPQPALSQLTAGLLKKYRDLEVLRQADKNYTTYANPSTMFGRIFPARDEKQFEMFVADELPGRCRRAVLRFETRADSRNLRIEAQVNGIKLEEDATSETELFPPLTVNKASARRENVRFFTVPVPALKFGVNRLEVTNRDRQAKHCDFISAELALYMSN